MRADFLGFALSSDGGTVLLGMGDSRVPMAQRPVDKNVLGLYSAAAPAHDFQLLSPGHIGGLTFDREELWACTSQFDRDFELMRSGDRGQTLEGVMRLTDLEGPVICPCDTSTGRACPDRWPRLCRPGASAAALTRTRIRWRRPTAVSPLQNRRRRQGRLRAAWTRAADAAPRHEEPRLPLGSQCLPSQAFPCSCGGAGTDARARAWYALTELFMARV